VHNTRQISLNICKPSKFLNVSLSNPSDSTQGLAWCQVVEEIQARKEPMLKLHQ